MSEQANSPAKGVLIALLVVAALGVGVWATVSMNVFGEREVQPVDVAKVDEVLLKWKQVGAFDTGLSSPVALAAVSGGICVVGDKALVTFAPDGQRVSTFDLPAAASCLSAGQNNRILVGLGDRVAWFDRDGKITTIAPTPEKTPFFTAILQTSEAIYAADSINVVVWRTSDEGKTWTRIDGRTADDDTGFVLRSGYFDLDAGGEGLLWIVNPGRLRIEAFTPDGTRKFTWGSDAATVAGFSGCCNPGHIAVGPRGHVATVDKGFEPHKPAKVKVFVPGSVDSPHEELESVVAVAQQFKDPSISLDVAFDAEGRVVVLELIPGGQVRTFERKANPAAPESADNE